MALAEPEPAAAAQPSLGVQ
ncbi:hypothetical protein CCACVL1_20642 [Corchorus capsularis]|uniref:Uncharacterized protein n=1 Tax=Corchorus capsularis TaxID=210143 RepID=A0A1R3HA81_COCAP|nr:hypothetical protein CCACVL1_20642 [Corchorus capsularis]